ncbi:MAG: hypothetical protein MMC33_009688, partial [Icmadophila ericetorum]|nr:hypothetical protein [Icmadophila ericetorum]
MQIPEAVASSYYYDSQTPTPGPDLIADENFDEQEGVLRENEDYPSETGLEEGCGGEGGDDEGKDDESEGKEEEGEEEESEEE